MTARNTPITINPTMALPEGVLEALAKNTALR
jgi:hypothetical protein